MDNQIVSDFLVKSRQATNLKELKEIFESALKSMGFEFWAYQIVPPSHTQEKPPVIIANYPEEWVAHYVEQSYNKIDTVIIEGPKQPLPFQWSSLNQQTQMSVKQKEFFNEASEYGLRDGLGIPIPSAYGDGYSMASMSSQAEPEELEKLLKSYGSHIHLMSLTYHLLAKDLIELDRITDGKPLKLTPREIESLQWTAKGKSAWDIGKILGISDNAVKFYLANTRTKLGVTSTREAAIRAAILGLIDPP